MADKTEWDSQMDMNDKEDLIELTDIIQTDSESDHPVLDLSLLEETISEEVPELLNPEMELDDIKFDDADEDSIEDPFSEEDPFPDIVFDEQDPDPVEEKDTVPVEEPEPELPDDKLISDAGPVISSDQIEAALERVIEKKFAQKIESILFEVMERVIEKEIMEIKETLQKDLDNIGKF